MFMTVFPSKTVHNTKHRRLLHQHCKKKINHLANNDQFTLSIPHPFANQAFSTLFLSYKPIPANQKQNLVVPFIWPNQNIQIIPYMPFFPRRLCKQIILPLLTKRDCHAS